MEKISNKKIVAHDGKIVIIGFGSIGQGTLPLILRHVDIPKENITIIAADERGRDVANTLGVNFIINSITAENHKSILESTLGPGDFLLNLAVDVSSVVLMKWCRERGVLYLDTSIETWPEQDNDPSLTLSERSNYWFREEILELRKTGSKNDPTAIVCQGANPGLVSYLLKEALLNIAQDTGHKADIPKTREEWAILARDLGIKVIHIAERDTQTSSISKTKDEFVNTWSIDGLHVEACMPAEMGWGTHEKEFPQDGARHGFGCDSAIYLNQQGYKTSVRSWTPLAGPYIGNVITHNESISISDFFTTCEGGELYRPTVYYAYHPCDDAVISLREVDARVDKLHSKHRLMREEILPGGVDELGVLLMGNEKGVYWYGSQLSIDETRTLVPYNNATSLQVTVSVLAGLIWALENPTRGILEADETDHVRMLEIMSPYLGNIVGQYSEWTPLQGRRPEDIPLFNEKNMDLTDPWQFKNFRIS
jgi:homospermidine synthase